MARREPLAIRGMPPLWRYAPYCALAMLFLVHAAAEPVRRPGEGDR